MNQQELCDRLKKAIPPGSIGRYDLLPVFADAALFEGITEYLASFYMGKTDYVASPEAIGWVLGAAVARRLGAGFIPLRKAGRLPYPEADVARCKYLDYSKTEKALEVKKGLLAPGSRVLVVDEWIETGATARCCIKLLEGEGCTVPGLATIGIDYNCGTKVWIDSGFAAFIGKDL